MDSAMDTRVALLEERLKNTVERLNTFERMNERDNQKIEAFIQETETRIMQFVRREFEDIESKLSEVIASAKELKTEQGKLAEANKEQQQQIKVNEAQTAQAILGIAAVVAFAEIILRYVL